MWFKVDDTFWGHRKAAGITNDALATWLRAGNWSSWQLTDGAIPRAMLLQCAGDATDAEAVAAELVDRTLWEEEATGWQFHDWSDYNPTRAMVMAKRKKDADRRREWLARASAKRSGVSHDVSTDVSHSVNHGVSHDVIQGDLGISEDGADDHAVIHSVSNPVSNAVHHAAPDPTRPDRREGRTNTGKQSSSGGNAREAEDEEEEEIIRQLMAMSHGLGHPLTRAQAAAYRASWPDKPGRYVLACYRRDPAGATRTVAPAKRSASMHRPSGEVLAEIRDRAGGGPGDDTYERGGAMARAMLGQRPDEPDDPHPPAEPEDEEPPADPWAEDEPQEDEIPF